MADAPPHFSKHVLENVDKILEWFAVSGSRAVLDMVSAIQLSAIQSSTGTSNRYDRVKWFIFDPSQSNLPSPSYPIIDRATPFSIPFMQYAADSPTAPPKSQKVSSDALNAPVVPVVATQPVTAPTAATKDESTAGSEGLRRFSASLRAANGAVTGAGIFIVVLVSYVGAIF